jgi:peptidoglycan/LPS O-acetylase OafA/YrhL
VLGDVRLRRPAAIALGWAGLAAIVYAVLEFGSGTPFPGTAALVPTLGAAALILAGSAAESVDRAGAGRLLSLRPCRYVGRISYAWYLWHWPALIFAAALWGPLSPVAGLAVVAASWVPTALTHSLVEEPFRHARRLIARGTDLEPGSIQREPTHPSPADLPSPTAPARVVVKGGGAPDRCQGVGGGAAGAMIEAGRRTAP